MMPARPDRLLGRAGTGVRFNEHLEAEGPLVFEHACRMGLEGIVSKRKGSRYQSGRFSRLGQGEEPRGACGHAAGRRGLGSIMVVKQRQETSKSVTNPAWPPHADGPGGWLSSSAN